MSMTCPHCKGEGRVIADKCKECYGQGRCKKKKNIKISIPAGVDTGMRLKMAGYGDAGEGGVLMVIFTYLLMLQLMKFLKDKMTILLLRFQ